MHPNSDDNWPRRVAILGVGLLGGSVAMSIRRSRPETVFVGYSRSTDRLADAIRRGIIDEATDSIGDACRDCDAVVVATPVDRIAAMVIEAAGHCPDDCLITDVGSTKSGIVAAVEKDACAAAKFVAAHPIAGSEKSGSQYAVANLFDHKVVVVTPGKAADSAMVQRTDRFWKMTGGKTVTMSVADHDDYLAAISHVPHLMSALVARMTPPVARSLVGTGWKDITRVASGDPEMWTAICRENRPAIVTELARLAEELNQLRSIVEDGRDDEMASWLAEAKRIKDQG
ncbi:prephenate dehydrogenase [Rubripirellula reticaptiva]|uniref:Prephenate dehydrogenase n=1 Tax=Rubripirellula reticaptiva TaxID=2528013 RepID=A0A5C6FDN7_9BACT|nr:prephenate dehydrogenase/arogenate dehydrogenase family protein [Rubripirellula reticaptiva]TWU58196.1 prephenate dehydrogenase [Rubripirellula reticaptiva]